MLLGDKKKLSKKQQVFVEEYLVDNNAAQAAIRAGYSRKNAENNGCNLLQIPIIQKAVNKAKKERSERTRIKQDDIIKELARIGFSDLTKAFTPGGALINPQDWDDQTKQAISSVEVVVRPTGERDADDRPILEHTHKIRLWDKLSALEKLGKHLGMFIDKSEVKSTFEVTIAKKDADAL